MHSVVVADGASSKIQIIFDFPNLIDKQHGKRAAELTIIVFCRRKRSNGVTLLPYWGLLRLLHHPLKVLYLLVWSQGRVFSSREQDSRLADGTTLVTSMLVRPSAKSSILTLIRFPPTCLLSRRVCLVDRGL